MKQITSKIIALFCIVCLLLTSGTVVLAAAAPSAAITLDRSGKSAQIKLNDVDMMFYSAQLTLHITPKNTDYTLTAANRNAYGTVNEKDGDVTLYVDSTDLTDGSKSVTLGTLKANKEITIAKMAELILVDRSMRPVTYDTIKVSVTKESSSSTVGSDGGTGTGNLSFSSVTPTPAPVATTEPNKTQFVDVPDTHWAKDDIAYVTDKGLFQGVGEGKFEPNTEMTRAMYVTVLSRFGTCVDAKWNIPCETPMHFIDVDDGQWYSEPIAWAGGTGLVNGIGENKFGPQESVTREQIAVMTVNFARLCGVRLPSDVAATEFPDAADIHDWAIDAVKTAQQAGLLNGREHGEFAPQATATRAEVAAILNRLVKLVK